MKIPSDNQWTQLNSGDIFGVLHESENISLAKRGKITLSRKAINRYNSDDDAGVVHTLAIAFYDDQYLALTSGNAYQYDFGSGSVTELSPANIATNSDMQVIYGRAYMTQNTNITYFNGSSFTTSVYTLTGSVPHPMAVFDSQTTYKLAVGDGNLVHLLDNASTANDSGTDLTLPAQYQVTTLAYRNGYLYVGTRHLNGGEAKIFVWDGATANANYEIPVGASWIYSLIPYKETVAGINNRGILFGISGNTAVELGQLPVAQFADANWQDDGTDTYMGKVLHRGMVTDKDNIYINVNGAVDSGFIPEMKSGIWVYYPNQGLVHRFYHSVDDTVIDSTITMTSNTITTTSAHGLKTGDPIIFTNVGSLTGISANTIYYVSVESTTTFKIARSRKAVKNSDTMTLGGSGTSASLRYTPNTDWGGGYAGNQGAISLTNPSEPTFELYKSNVIWGASFNDLSGTAFYALLGLTDSWNIGRFTTQRIYTANISQTWKNLFGYIDGCLLDNEKIKVKVKSYGHGYPTPVITGAWNGTSAINSTDSVVADIKDGDELSLIDGVGRGYTVHVVGTPTVSGGGTWTINVDEAIGTDSSAVTFYADNFKLIHTANNSRESEELINAGPVEKKSGWIQLKVELRGFEIEVSLLDLINAVDKKAI